MDTIRKVALVDYGRLELQENCGDVKTLEPGTIKIDVAAYSICGDGIVLYRGKRSLENERYFRHEFSSVVMDPGNSTNGIGKGMRVASEFSRACGHCWNCRNEFSNYYRSMNDALLPGGFSEETLVLSTQEYSFISPVPDTIDDITATPLEPTSCAYYVARQANVKYGEIVVVFGVEPMGLIASRIIKSMGVDVVVGVDNSKARLEEMRNLGLIEVIGSNDGSQQGQIFEMCGSKGADVIIGLTGALPVLQNALQVIHPGGRIVVDSIYGGFTEQVELLPTIHKELTIRDSKGPYPYLKTDGASAAVDIPVRLQDDLKKLITICDYKDTLKALDGMISGLTIKSVIRFQS